MKSRTVLVTDADRASAVTVIRSLGRTGWKVIAADSKPRSLGSRSRYAAESLVYPDPDTRPEGFAEFLRDTLASRGVDLVIPITDEVIQAMLPVRDELEELSTLALPAPPALERAQDKAETVRLAEELGVPVPRTRVVETCAEALEAAAELGWPIVIKPARSRLYLPERGVVEHFSVTYAENSAELERQIRALDGHVKVLLQEYCPGQGEGVELLAHEGRVIAAFQHRRLAEVPVTGGASAWRESVPLSPELLAHATRLAEALGWTGLLMVEFRVGEDARLIEINGRIWGSLPLAVLSGMDFPSRLAELLTGGGPVGNGVCDSDYRVGVRAFNLELTLNWMTRVLLGLNPYPFLPSPPRRRCLAAAFGLLSPRQRLDLASREDPRPALAEPGKILRKFARKIRRKTFPPGGQNGA